MKSLSNTQDYAEIMTRLGKLQADSQRRWGRMTAHQMLCHLSDSFQAKLGNRTSTMADNLFTRTVMKWVALYLPLPWPHGVKTMPENDQLIGGTPPEEFERDRQRLVQLIEGFTKVGDPAALKPHPYFGQMSEAEWLRWGYLHADHHLRQFGL
jgi:hypothetical protein